MKNLKDVYKRQDAIIFIDVSGCQWRLLPKEYPKWQTVYYYFRRWGAMDAFAEIAAASSSSPFICEWVVEAG